MFLISNEYYILNHVLYERGCFFVYTCQIRVKIVIIF
nr:MAG TPA: ATP synthase [Caudoviricetes sp.]